MGKRTRQYTQKGSKRSTKKRRTTRKPFVKGKDRTGGFYGRYQGMGREQKFFDTALAFAFDATAESAASNSLGQVDLIPQGTTESQRIGRKCVVRSIQVKGQLAYTPAAAANGFDATEMYLILDKQTNGAQAAFTDVFDTANITTNFVDLANSARFRILKKWTHNFNATAGVTTAYNGVSKFINYYKKCNIPLEFSSTTGAITELKSNHIFLAYGSFSQDDTVSFAGACRLRFDD